jgi:hypothetical protein
VLAAVAGVRLAVAPLGSHGGLLVVATVACVPSVDDWATLLVQHLQDGQEFPVYRAATAAVARWGGRVEIQDPGTKSVDN